MSPLFVEILLWHHTRLSQYPWADGGTAQIEIRTDMILDGLLEADECNPPNFLITEKGNALVEAILATPMPVQKWVPA